MKCWSLTNEEIDELIDKKKLDKYDQLELLKFFVYHELKHCTFWEDSYVAKIAYDVSKFKEVNKEHKILCKTILDTTAYNYINKVKLRYSRKNGLKTSLTIYFNDYFLKTFDDIVTSYKKRQRLASEIRYHFVVTEVCDRRKFKRTAKFERQISNFIYGELLK